MTMTDPIADMLTRIRNALMIKAPDVTMPASKMKVGICRVLKDEGFVGGYSVLGEEGSPKATLQIQLKYDPEGDPTIRHLARVSTPGCRRYRGVGDIPKELGGLGVFVLTTPKGILSDRECRKENVGGELLCKVH